MQFGTVGGAKKDWGGRIRTSNLLVNSQALRQLSYTPMKNRPLGGYRAGGCDQSQNAATRSPSRPVTGGCGYYFALSRTRSSYLCIGAGSRS